MTRLVNHLRANAVAYLALFVALGGTSYAALRIPAGSVGTKQLRNGGVTPAKLSTRYFAGNIRAWAVVSPSGKVDVAVGNPTVKLFPSAPSTYEIRWGRRLSRHCLTLSNVESRGTEPTETVSVPGDPSLALAAGYVVVSGSGSDPTSGLSSTALTTFDQSGQPTPMAFDIAIIC